MNFSSPQYECYFTLQMFEINMKMQNVHCKLKIKVNIHYKKKRIFKNGSPLELAFVHLMNVKHLQKGIEFRPGRR